MKAAILEGNKFPPSGWAITWSLPSLPGNKITVGGAVIKSQLAQKALRCKDLVYAELCAYAELLRQSTAYIGSYIPLSRKQARGRTGS